MYSQVSMTYNKLVASIKLSIRRACLLFYLVVSSHKRVNMTTQHIEPPHNQGPEPINIQQVLWHNCLHQSNRHNSLPQVLQTSKRPPNLLLLLLLLLLPHLPLIPFHRTSIQNQAQMHNPNLPPPPPLHSHHHRNTHL